MPPFKTPDDKVGPIIKLILMSSKPEQTKEQWRTEYFARTEALEKARTREIAAMTEEEAVKQIRSLSVAETPWRERPNWSGLVEQQAIFHRKKKP